MKSKKGTAGYINRQKKYAIGKTAAEFGIVAALLALGIWQTKTRLNWLTIFAVLGTLPAAKSLVEMIMILPHHSIDAAVAEDVQNKAPLLTTAYDMVFTSEKQVMPVDCIVISNNNICGYSSDSKMDIQFAAKHLKQMLYANQCTNISVKIFDNYKAFLSRAEGLNNIAAVEKADTREQEEKIRSIILNLSL